MAWFDQDRGLKTGKLHDFGRGLVSRIEIGGDRPGNLQSAGDEFGTEKGMILGEVIECGNGNLGDHRFDPRFDGLEEVVGDALLF